VYDVYRRVRHLIHTYYQNQYRRTRLGLQGRAVEIDESRFTHRGRDEQKLYVLGLYERGSKDLRCFVMRDRSEITCSALVKENVAEGAEIYTEFSKGYSGLKEFYNHTVVNRHKGERAEYETVQRMSQLWHLIKRNIHTYSSIRVTTLQKYLDEACWRIKMRTYPEREQFLMQLMNV
jgi:transposase-like protein